jgi:hypothetical protein
MAVMLYRIALALDKTAWYVCHNKIQIITM